MRHRRERRQQKRYRRLFAMGVILREITRTVGCWRGGGGDADNVKIMPRESSRGGDEMSDH